MKRKLTAGICSFVFFFSLFPASSQPVLNYPTPIVSGLDFPVDVVNAGDGSDRLFIVQQAGLIKLYKNATLTTFLDLTGVVFFGGGSDERGLLSMAFHPDYDGVTNRYFFVYYTTTSGITTIRIARYKTKIGDPDLLDPAAPDQVIAIPKTDGNSNHNGGKLNFGNDGMLYFGTGDGGGSNDVPNNAQNGNSLLGKMLRIDINGTDEGFYSIPADNPYLVSMDGIRDEIWALGLRNPFRWSFDPVTNAMWIGDVGQGAREEVDVRLPGPTTGHVNYGWRCYEGNIQPPSGITACNPLPSDYVAPIYEYGHNFSTGGFAITGGYVYRGTDFPSLYGYYVFADYISGNVWVMTQAGVATQQTDLANVAGFGEDEDRELYAVSRGGSLGQGALYRIQSNIIPSPVTLVGFTARNTGGYNELRWSTAYEQNADRYLIEYGTDGSNFTIAGEVAAMNSASGYNYIYRHTIADTRKIFYRLKMIDQDASSRYSSVISIGGKNAGGVTLYSTILQNNKLELNAETPVERLQVYDSRGKQVFSNNLNGRQGYFSIQLPTMARGIYFLTIQGKEYNKTERIIVQ